MPDTILDDVNALLLREKGDKRILEQIRRAAENNEVISIYERNYVSKLRAQYLERKPEPEPRLIPLQPSQISQAPRVVTKTDFGAPARPEPQRRRHPQRTKVIAGAGGVAALIAIIVIGVSLSGMGPGGPSPTSGNLLSLDERSYALGDIILISGRSNSSLGAQVVLSIENSDNNLVWTENVDLKLDGEFSTLAIAGGTGWSDSGMYTLVFEHGNKTESLDFTFQG